MLFHFVERLERSGLVVGYILRVSFFFFSNRRIWGGVLNMK